MRERPEVQVIGGGFCGLSAAYFLARSGRRVRLVEKSGRFGGLIRTLETPYGIVETAANALLANQVVEETAAELGISLLPTLPSAKRRFIYRNGKPRRWTLSLQASLGLALGGSARYLLRRSSFQPRSRETVEEWGLRCVGKEATDYLLGPALAGVYAASPGSLSASLILGRFFGGAKVARGKLKGSVAPSGGMQEWTDGFVSALKTQGVEFSNQPLEDLPTVVALPPHRALEFLEGKAPALCRSLAKVRMLPLVSVTCFLPEDAPGIEGFGCLFPAPLRFQALGILANDRIFPGRSQGARSETWIYGGEQGAAALDLSDSALVSVIQEERRRLHGTVTSVIHKEVTRWPKAIPAYDLALEEALEELKALDFQEHGYHLFGTYLGDLGLARVLSRAKELPSRL